MNNDNDLNLHRMTKLSGWLRYCGQTMEKTDKRWKRRTNDGKDGQTMEKTDKRWKRRTNDGKDRRVF